jgi:hypothetical protein
LHKEIRLIRDFDLRMARESHRQLEEPGLVEDERIMGTPLMERVNDPADPGGRCLASCGWAWLEAWRRIRFRALTCSFQTRDH